MATQFRLDDELGEMSQAELARRAGLGLSTVNRIYMNRSKQVSLETLGRISKVLGCAPGDLLEEKPERKRKRARR